jgi:uncharacterized protein YegL
MSETVHIAIVVDESGSMDTIKNSMEAALKEFIQEQNKNEGKVTATIAKFSSKYKLVHDFVDLKDVEAVTINPDGPTALLDAMGETMENVKSKIHLMEDKPKKGIFIFITDGEENASKKYTRSQINEMIEALKSDEDTKWEVVFMGSNQDSIKEGAIYGIRSGTCLDYASNDKSIKASFNSLSAATTYYRKSDEMFSFQANDQDELLVDKKD